VSPFRVTLWFIVVMVVGPTVTLLANAEASLGQLAELAVIEEVSARARGQRRWIAREVLDAETKPI
jgi:hypothetical protein